MSRVMNDFGARVWVHDVCRRVNTSVLNQAQRSQERALLDRQSNVDLLFLSDFRLGHFRYVPVARASFGEGRLLLLLLFVV